MNAGEIIGAILEIKGLNAKSFSERIGLDRPQAIYDIQKGKVRSVSAKMCDKILSVYPDLNRVWILTGEGPMFIDMVGDEVNGDGGNLQKTVIGHNISGNGNKVVNSETEKLLELLKKKDEQMDRLIGVIEKLTK